MRGVTSLVLFFLLFGCSASNYGDSFLSLRYASHGKDVIWIPTKREIAVAMLLAANVSAEDVLYDLGSGDGVIPIQAARQFGSKAVGIEYNPDLVALAERNASRAKVENLVSFKRGDIFSEDFSQATVITLYLGEDINIRLKPTLLSMKPGTRIVSNTFKMGTWIPDQELKLNSGERAYLWTVPVKLEGRWELSGPPPFEDVSLSIRQRKQFFDALLSTRSQKKVYTTEGRIDGAKVFFEVTDSDGKRFSFRGEAKEGRLTGSLNNDSSLLVSGLRSP
jgi:precorrin-6B methylase 2